MKAKNLIVSKLILVQGHIGLCLIALSIPAFANDGRIKQAAQAYVCEDTFVTEVGYYFKDVPDSGIYAKFNSKLGVASFKDVTVSVVDRSVPLHPVISKEKVDDKVQVCLLSTPVKDQYCNPEQDSRGHYYRIFDYRLKSAYIGTNGNHMCGGA